jgi:phage terminase large subunit
LILKRKVARVFQPLLDDARYKGAHGGRGCVHPDTLIDTPYGQVKIKDFKGGPVYSYKDGDIVISTATQPKAYTVEQLYEVNLDCGRSIVVTDEHKFLTSRGWVELKDLCDFDEVVFSPYLENPSPLETSLGTCPSVSGLGVQRSIEKREGCQGGYSLCHHQYGRPPQFLEGTALSSLQSLGGEAQHNSHVLCRSGGLGFSGIYSPSSVFGRFSSRGAPLALEEVYCEVLGNCIGAKSFVLSLVTRLTSRLSLYCKSLLARAAGFLGPFRVSCIGLGQDGIRQEPLGTFPYTSVDNSLSDQALRSPIVDGCKYKYSTVRQVRKHSRQRYWDLHVYGTNNYLSCGIVNHNSGKSHFFVEQLIEDSLCERGLLSVCIREVQKSLKESAYRLLTGKLKELNLGEKDGFKVWKDRIETPGDGQIIFQGMQDHTAESIKSLEGFKRAWVEESQTLSALSMRLLRPTIRAEGSQIWFSWNPRRKNDPVDELLRQGEPPTNSVVVQANWSDNPWFPSVLEAERLDCYQQDPDQYGHIWDGDYISVAEGAYYAKHLALARKDGRVGRLREDPLLPFKLFVDIGGTGAKADAFSMWAAQFVGKETRVLNYYEVQGQPLEHHLNWMRESGYTKANTKVYLPHDGSTNDRVYDVSYESAFKQAGYQVEVIPNQGKGAASKRIEAGRRVFSNCWFDSEKCEGGLEALGWYHEKKDEARNIGLGPEHDWASHGSDAFGLMAIVRERPTPKWDKIKYQNQGIV